MPGLAGPTRGKSYFDEGYENVCFQCETWQYHDYIHNTERPIQCGLANGHLEFRYH